MPELRACNRGAAIWVQYFFCCCNRHLLTAPQSRRIPIRFLSETVSPKLDFKNFARTLFPQSCAFGGVRTFLCLPRVAGVGSSIACETVIGDVPGPGDLDATEKDDSLRG